MEEQWEAQEGSSMGLRAPVNIPTAVPQRGCGVKPPQGPLEALAEAEWSQCWYDMCAMELTTLPGNCYKLEGIHLLCLDFCSSDYEFPQEQVVQCLFRQKSAPSKVHGIFTHHSECSHNREMVKISLMFVQTEQEGGKMQVTPPQWLDDFFCFPCIGKKERGQCLLFSLQSQRAQHQHGGDPKCQAIS